MQTAIFLPPQTPAPSGTGPGIDAAAAHDVSAGATRLHRLFRASLRAGQVHPLWRLLHVHASREPVRLRESRTVEIIVTFSSDSFERYLLTVKPALEKARSDAADVAGTDKTRRTSVCS